MSSKNDDDIVRPMSPFQEKYLKNNARMNLAL